MNEQAMDGLMGLTREHVELDLFLSSRRKLSPLGCMHMHAIIQYLRFSVACRLDLSLVFHKQVSGLTMVRHDLIIALSLCLSVSVSAFSVSPATPTAIVASPRLTTRLYAEQEESDKESDGSENAAEDHVLPSESGSDILNSPAFLKRKVDVLKSDIAKAENDLEELKEKVAAGKAEWGDQLDDLQLEVCFLCVSTAG